jgi:hypothetical protein
MSPSCRVFYQNGPARPNKIGSSPNIGEVQREAAMDIIL